MQNLFPQERSVNWEQEIKAVKQRLQKIEQDNGKYPSSSYDFENEAIAELSRTLEELQVAAEEIQQQNEQLVATRQELEQERQSYQELFEFAPDGYLVTNDYGIIQEANSAAINMLNVPKQYLKGKPLEIFVTQSSRKNFRRQSLGLTLALIQYKSKNTPSYLQKNQSKYFEVDLQPRQRDSFPVLMSVCGSYNCQNKSISLRWLLRDLTEYKQAEAKIHEQATLLDIATDAILVRDLNLQILFWNQGSERLYGWKAEQVLGKNSRDLFEIGSQIEDALKGAIDKGEWRGELHKTTKSGRKIIVESHWTLVRDEANNPKSVFSVETDVTERKQIQQQLVRSQSLEKISMLATGLSHDLANIFNPIMGAAQLLSDKFPGADDRTKELLNLLQTNVERGAALIQRIVSSSRQDVQLKLAEVRFKDLLQEIEQIVKQTFPKSIQFCCELPKDLWLLHADATQLHQVLMNLVVNARDAMPDGGTLKLSAENIFLDENFVQSHPKVGVGPYIIIKVADTGRGIPAENLEWIFEPLFTTKDIGKGTGLGLASVANIVEIHKGFVQVDSKVGQGTEFQVFLPAANC